MNKHWTAIELLRHARHDWLNKIQLIQGYISLNNVERVKEILSDIIAEAHQESNLSNMYIPEFASLLLTYNWEGHAIHLEYEVLERESQEKRTVDDRFLSDWTCSFFEVLNSSVEVFAENHLIITLEQLGEGYSFFFDFRGKIIKQEIVMNFLQENSSIVRNIHEFSEHEFTLELFMPYL